jgi:hypothetical protein
MFEHPRHGAIDGRPQSAALRGKIDELNRLFVHVKSAIASKKGRARAAHREKQNPSPPFRPFGPESWRASPTVDRFLRNLAARKSAAYLIGRRQLTQFLADGQ